MTPLPHDRDLERRVIGAAILSDRGYRVAAAVVEFDDFYYQAHRQIWRARPLVGEVGPFFSADIDGIAELWPLTLPSSRHVRQGAIATLCPDVPFWAIAALAGLAPPASAIKTPAKALRELGNRRRRLVALEAEMRELVGR